MQKRCSITLNQYHEAKLFFFITAPTDKKDYKKDLSGHGYDKKDWSGYGYDKKDWSGYGYDKKD